MARLLLIAYPVDSFIAASSAAPGSAACLAQLPSGSCAAVSTGRNEGQIRSDRRDYDRHGPRKYHGL